MKKSKYSLSVIFAAAGLVLLGAGAASAQRTHVIVNGSPVRFDTFGPTQLYGHTMIPIRGVLEKLGAEVAWVESSQTVVASAPHMQIQMGIGDHNATVNDRKVPMDVPAQVLNGHTMVPLRFLAEALGADVRWDETARTAIIVTRDRQRGDGSNTRDRGTAQGRRLDRGPGDAPMDRRPGERRRIDPPLDRGSRSGGQR